jgi:exosortase/archaeosortase family protein
VIAYPGARLFARKSSRVASFPAGLSVFLVLLLTLIAVSADQLASPILRTTSPLMATLAFLLFVWRRGHSPLLDTNATRGRSLSIWLLAGFFAMHLALILVSRSFTGVAQPFSGTATLNGTVVGLAKLAVLAPTLMLLPFHHWKRLVRAYGPEAIVAILVLAVNVPHRFVEFIWPWYGRMLGWFVYLLARVFVSGLTYQVVSEPTILGPSYDTGLVLNCSGVDAFELLSYLFSFVILLDWNHFRKGRAILIYLGCLSSILLCNIPRIAAVVVLHNRGYAGLASGFHLSSGPFFFCSIFLIYMSLTYSWMTESRQSR